MNFLPIVFSCDNNYFKYTLVVIQSILCNLNKNIIYEFNILSKDISNENMHISHKLIDKYPNSSIKFIDISMYDFSKFYLNSYMNESTYYRFLIPKIFNKYERILYLDSDLIIENDISFYTNIDFENNAIIASPSIYCQNLLIKNDDAYFNLNYLNNILNIQSPKQYFNAGVILFNIKKIQEENINMLKSINQIKNPIYQDQDLLNSLFNNFGGVKIISNRYNNAKKYKISKKRIVINSLLYKFNICKRNNWFTIYHYVGKEKGWQYFNIDSYLFLYYAYKTPFITDIFNENKNLNISYFDKLILKYISKI